MPCTDLTQPIVYARPCTTCGYGVLMYPIEQRRGRCLVCQMRADGKTWKIERQRHPFRTEAKAYNESIWDDD